MEGTGDFKGGLEERAGSIAYDTKDELFHAMRKDAITAAAREPWMAGILQHIIDARCFEDAVANRTTVASRPVPGMFLGSPYGALAARRASMIERPVATTKPKSFWRERKRPKRAIPAGHPVSVLSRSLTSRFVCLCFFLSERIPSAPPS